MHTLTGEVMEKHPQQHTIEMLTNQLRDRIDSQQVCLHLCTFMSFFIYVLVLYIFVPHVSLHKERSHKSLHFHIFPLSFSALCETRCLRISSLSNVSTKMSMTRWRSFCSVCANTISGLNFTRSTLILNPFKMKGSPHRTQRNIQFIMHFYAKNSFRRLQTYHFKAATQGIRGKNPTRFTK